MSRDIAVFDFDGTLTRRDSLIGLGLYTQGRWSTAIAMACVAPLWIAERLKLARPGTAKQRFFAQLFSGEDAAQFERDCKAFAHHAMAHGLMRPDALDALHTHLQLNDAVLIDSANIEPLLKAFAELLGIPAGNVLATSIELDASRRITGRFASLNCWGPEKVNRLVPALERFKPYGVISAYGDSRGDRELLAFSSDPHYRRFFR